MPVLVLKEGITKIQLPSSMQKVKQSVYSTGQDEKADILVCKDGVIPSARSQSMGKLLLCSKGETRVSSPPKMADPFCSSSAQNDQQPHEVLRAKMSESFHFSLAGIHKRKLQSMFIFTISEKVPRSVLEEYESDCIHGKTRHGKVGGIQHMCLRGLTDPTTKVPYGKVFLTGVIGVDFPDFVCIGAFPCTEITDSLSVALLKEKPDKMNNTDWDFLCRLPFGGIIFGSPSGNQIPLPNLIAGGDLDGDYYQVGEHLYGIAL